MSPDQANEIVDALDEYMDAREAAQSLPKDTRRGEEAHERAATCRELLVEALSEEA